LNTSNYVIDGAGEEYILERIIKLRKEIAISFLIAFGVPFVFVFLKSNLFETITPPMIFTGVLMATLSSLVMFKALFTKSKAIKAIVKEVSFYEDNIVEITVVHEKKLYRFSKDDLSLHGGYKGPQKLKNIFDEPTYRLEHWKEGVVVYFISSYFKNWDELAFHFKKLPN
jgi:hypothetical protein